ncbi:MAG: YebC/PmpR family DNA-binding transcriptional regulator [Planctomycetes bacterium]|nr:YebC/PmpR family DNA-binding transcriptional regulator [Planctomycetota bacterium]
MAGHSHSSNIAARKGAVDKQRSKNFNKLSRQIMSAVRQGGQDIESNLKLKYAVEKARAANVPKDNIERVIKRAAGEAGGDMEEVVYEGYAPGGIALMVACLTDNRHRTSPDLKHVFDKFGGNLGTPGSVGFLFQQRSIFVCDAQGEDEDHWVELGLECGAQDVQLEGDVATLLALPTEYLGLKAQLEARGVKLHSAEIGYVPLNSVAVADKETASKVLRIVAALDDLDDVQSVYANYDIPGEWIEELST